jgi:hypothetical protein
MLSISIRNVARTLSIMLSAVVLLPRRGATDSIPSISNTHSAKDEETMKDTFQSSNLLVCREVALMSRSVTFANLAAMGRRNSLPARF